MNERELLAAQGYLELGMIEEALAALVDLPFETLEEPEVVELRLHIFMQAQRWNDALSMAELLRRLCPNSIYGFIHGSFCLHELGRTSEARDLLLEGPATLQKDPTYFYNLGCYEAMLGNQEAALHSLRKSFGMDKNYREFARNDPDLQAVVGKL